MIDSLSALRAAIPHEPEPSLGELEFSGRLDRRRYDFRHDLIFAAFFGLNDASHMFSRYDEYMDRCYRVRIADRKNLVFPENKIRVRFPLRDITEDACHDQLSGWNFPTSSTTASTISSSLTRLTTSPFL